MMIAFLDHSAKTGRSLQTRVVAVRQYFMKEKPVMQTPFSSEAIARHCLAANFAPQVALEVVQETGSTNLDLLSRVALLRQPTLLLAERQTAGRGRAGRTWHSAAGASLTFSLAWKFALPLQALIGLPLAVGVAIADALAAQAVRVQLKWPNDILRDGKKLGGVLIATSGVGQGAAQSGVLAEQNWAVIGIGLNLTVPGELEQEIGHLVADAPWLAQQDRNLLMALLLQHLVSMLKTFEQHGIPAFVSRWNHYHAFSGQMVQILDHGQLLHEGRAVGIDGMGRLLLDTANGQVAVLAGDVSLRPS
jgi:BirA family biotin operon repressor/biotin-[acetyl-CoA-carboxylase] ligase